MLHQIIKIKLITKIELLLGWLILSKKNEEIEIPILEIRKEVESEQNDRLSKIKQERNESEVLAKLEKIQECCKNNQNLMPFIIDAVESYATLEEIVNSMKSVFGEWQEKAFF